MKENVRRGKRRAVLSNFHDRFPGCPLERGTRLEGRSLGTSVRIKIRGKINTQATVKIKVHCAHRISKSSWYKFDQQRVVPAVSLSAQTKY